MAQNQAILYALRGSLLRWCFVLLLVYDCPAQDLSDRALIVYNTNSAASLSVAQHYQTKRGISQRNLCPITPPAPDELNWAAFNATVKSPIRACLNSLDPERKILYLVLTYATPFRITAGIPAIYNHPQGELFAVPGRAVDSYLIDLWDAYPVRENPYFVNADTKNNVYQDFQSLAEFLQRNAGPPIYGVWRLDGPTPEIAQGLVDKAIVAETYGLRGRACFDRNRGLFQVLQEADTSYLAADWDMYRAAEFTRKMGWDTTEDFIEAEFGTPPAPALCTEAAFYSGWYSFNNYNDVFTWVPGAIGWHLDSASAFNPRGGANWAANALQRGITVTTGAVEEPFVRPFPKTDQVVRYLFQGANVGDAFLRSTLFKEWQFLNFGDPLYRPFPLSTFPPPNRGLLRGWRKADIGQVGAQGTANYYNGNYALTSTGIGLTGNADSAHFAYVSLDVDGEITARLARPENTSGGGLSAFAGIMLRESLSPSSSFIALGVTPGENYRLVARAAAGNPVAILQETAHGAEMWVRLARYGNQIAAFSSANGLAWTPLGVANAPFSTKVFAGLTLSSGATDRNNESFFDRVVIRSKPKRGGNSDPPLHRAVDSNGAFRIVWQR